MDQGLCAVPPLSAKKNSPHKVWNHDVRGHRMVVELETAHLAINDLANSAVCTVSDFEDHRASLNGIKAWLGVPKATDDFLAYRITLKAGRPKRLGGHEMNGPKPAGISQDVLDFVLGATSISTTLSLSR